MPRDMTTQPGLPLFPKVTPHPHAENQNKQRSVIPAIDQGQENMLTNAKL